MRVENFDVDPGSSNADGLCPGHDRQDPLFFLDSAYLAVTKDSSGPVKLDGTKVELPAQAAAALNTTSSRNALQSGMLIGIAHVTARLTRIKQVAATGR